MPPEPLLDPEAGGVPVADRKRPVHVFTKTPPPGKAGGEDIEDFPQATLPQDDQQ